MITFKNGLKDGIPIALGYLSVSFTFGILAAASGLDAPIAILISMTNMTSAGQLAGLNIMMAGGGVIELILSQLVINMRYGLMSISLSQKFDSKTSRLKKSLLAFGNTDEVFAVSMSKKEDINGRYFFGLMLLPYIFWSLGTILGSLSGNILPESMVSALSIALYAMFIAIIIPPAKRYKSVAIVISISIILGFIFKFSPLLKNISSGFAVIIISIVACLIGAYFFPLKEDGDRE